MKTKFLKDEFLYDGSQMKPLDNYLKYDLLGDSCLSWIGPCEISFDKMLDGEDLIEKCEIRGSKMLHFIFEIFQRELVSAVFLQRLFASLVQAYVFENSKIYLKRDGDDLYLEDKKFSISIAAPSINSNMVHFAVNVSNLGTPVKTVSCEDLNIKPEVMAEVLLKKISHEYQSIINASFKVRAIHN
ncbi:MAG: DUF366 family protein [Bdellovibrionales bacterium]